MTRDEAVQLVQRILDGSITDEAEVTATLDSAVLTSATTSSGTSTPT